ncbi:hypothetical protein EVAR_29921_1 [Eumeta japonica]|uniref:Uncharacterized protein n=1 Tax=Eumeta variegata TaxID=151549 RepID=A0A4C1V999_EUMVA|nr:hypothetical protein EVAR_29921_1 [Eumeta japonica]
MDSALYFHSDLCCIGSSSSTIVIRVEGREQTTSNFIHECYPFRIQQTHTRPKQRVGNKNRDPPQEKLPKKRGKPARGPEEKNPVVFAKTGGRRRISQLVAQKTKKSVGSRYEVNLSSANRIIVPVIALIVLPAQRGRATCA